MTETAAAASLAQKIDPDRLELLAEMDHAAGVLTLNRPEKLNVLNHAMRSKIMQALKDWRRDPILYALIIKATGEKDGRRAAFCAGGDIKEMLRDVVADPRQALESVGAEYALNWALRTFTYPGVALMDGVCMGSGLGLAMHLTHRVAGDNFAFAMPEVAIGFFPDVGATYVLPRLAGEFGTYLALTGRTIGAADAYHLGLVSHCIATSGFAALQEALAEAYPIDQVLDPAHHDPGLSKLRQRRATIDRAFSAPTVGEILDRLDKVSGTDRDWAIAVREEIASKCPTSLVVALAQMRAGKAADLRQALIWEYRIARWMLIRADFAEGVRAVLIDRDGAPKWSPGSLEDVDVVAIEGLFTPGEQADDLQLPATPVVPKAIG